LWRIQASERPFSRQPARSKRACGILILTIASPLLEQWRVQLAIFLGIDDSVRTAAASAIQTVALL
jgi:hypothetical protein